MLQRCLRFLCRHKITDQRLRRRRLEFLPRQPVSQHPLAYPKSFKACGASELLWTIIKGTIEIFLPAAELTRLRVISDASGHTALCNEQLTWSQFPLLRVQDLLADTTQSLWVTLVHLSFYHVCLTHHQILSNAHKHASWPWVYLWMFNNGLYQKRKKSKAKQKQPPMICMWANFFGVNTFNIADFKLTIWPCFPAMRPKPGSFAQYKSWHLQQDTQVPSGSGTVVLNAGCPWEPTEDSTFI